MLSDVQAHADRAMYTVTMAVAAPRLAYLAPLLDPEDVAKMLWAYGKAFGGSSNGSSSNSSDSSMPMRGAGMDGVADSHPNALSDLQRRQQQQQQWQGHFHVASLVHTLVARMPSCMPHMSAQSCAMAVWGLAMLGHRDQVSAGRWEPTAINLGQAGREGPSGFGHGMQHVDHQVYDGIYSCS